MRLSSPLVYFAKLRKHCLALKLKWEHDKAINRTRSRWEESVRHPATPATKPSK